MVDQGEREMKVDGESLGERKGEMGRSGEMKGEREM